MEDALGMKIILNQRKIVKDVVVSCVLHLILIEDNATITGGQHAVCLLSCRMSLQRNEIL